MYRAAGSSASEHERFADRDLTLLECFQAINAPQERALAAAGWSDQRRDLPLADFE